ncbi:glycosyltransferase family 32 protein [Fusobacterium necrophorum]|uniref:Glycosyl transferase n=1 Tax=Fusobacterium necrophorum DJ-2 TaxID=1441737 RepID=A0AB73C0A0_9FUSO|nr:glycosyltransferase [Fusobacterium necrophorum]KDE63559.1 glycosyl transferase [Fusobacterium necrophorum DJ-1]KDE67188.1 glycosyl transferase [Fusobacterium necrophorum BFTR-1]KDE67583.1 glycosyl transferase [Fusobacterium necrophorum DAB]KDE69332.1 glycosyl transferase [Fusobacterium necrophorum DJ-2]MCF0163578.1 glycosyl transferase [Fusobacterium necrophorum]
MIPKKIHYCWFGHNPFPEDFKKYLETWKKFCPEYEIKEWNEENFDLSLIPYTKEAYKNKKWAFITDYVRLYALYTEGGIYLDTDVEILRNLDYFLELKAFSGFENKKSIPTGIMGSESQLPIFKEMLDYYKNIHFENEDGSLNLQTNVVTITEHFKKKGMRLDNSKQTIEDFTFFPKEYFCPKDYRTLDIKITENTYTIHHFASSWIPKRNRINNLLKKILGPKLCTLILKCRLR